MKAIDFNGMKNETVLNDLIGALTKLKEVSEITEKNTPTKCHGESIMKPIMKQSAMRMINSTM